MHYNIYSGASEIRITSNFEGAFLYTCFIQFSYGIERKIVQIDQSKCINIKVFPINMTMKMSCWQQLAVIKMVYYDSIDYET